MYKKVKSVYLFLILEYFCYYCVSYLFKQKNIYMKTYNTEEVIAYLNKELPQYGGKIQQESGWAYIQIDGDRVDGIKFYDTETCTQEQMDRYVSIIKQNEALFTQEEVIEFLKTQHPEYAQYISVNIRGLLRIDGIGIKGVHIMKTIQYRKSQVEKIANRMCRGCRMHDKEDFLHMLSRDFRNNLSFDKGFLMVNGRPTDYYTPSDTHIPESALTIAKQAVIDVLIEIGDLTLEGFKSLPLNIRMVYLQKHHHTISYIKPIDFNKSVYDGVRAISYTFVGINPSDSDELIYMDTNTIALKLSDVLEGRYGWDKVAKRGKKKLLELVRIEATGNFKEDEYKHFAPSPIALAEEQVKLAQDNFDVCEKKKSLKADDLIEYGRTKGMLEMAMINEENIKKFFE